MSDRVAELEHELAHLEWRKSRNARRIHDILAANKQRPCESNEESEGNIRKCWEQAIEEDEMQKPLLLPEPVLHRIRTSQQQQEAAYARTRAKHIQSLESLEEALMCRLDAASTVREEDAILLHQIRQLKGEVSARH